jgi:L-ascorbate metabolism protein UlaG (beta-lactamase superfamily)
MAITITHLGTATTILEVDGVRLVTDPVFDPPGAKWSFGWGMTSTMTAAVAKPASDIGAVDAVLLSHDQHGDNLDHSGRVFLKEVKQVVTTNAAAKRLGADGVRVIGLAPFSSIAIKGASEARLRITATPARHGPPLSTPFVGDVIGFVLEGDEGSAVYVTGDTVFYTGVEEVAKRFTVQYVIAHLGCAKYGPLRFTMNAEDAVKLARVFPSATIVPIHYDGWTHFKESRATVEGAFAQAALTDRVKWLERGVPCTL